MTVEIQGEERDVRYRDRIRGLRIEVCWRSDEGDSETGVYCATRHFSNKVETEEGEYINRRGDLTHALIEEAIETILDETAQDDAEFVTAEIWERVNARQIGSRFD